MGTKLQNITDPKSCWRRAAEDEPVFVLLGRDKSAPVAIRAWIHHRLITGKSHEQSPEIVAARDEAIKMEEYERGRGREKL